MRETPVNLHHGTSCAQTEKMNSKDQDFFAMTRGARRWGLRLSSFSSFAAFAAVYAWGALVSAQPVVFQNVKAERSPDTRSATEALRWIINRDECAADDAYFRFNLSVTGWDLNESLEIWGTTSGADCTDYNQRNGVNAACFQLKPKGQVNRSGQSPQTFTLEFATKDVVALAKDIADDCGESSSDITQRNVTIHFMLLASGQFVAGGGLTWAETKIDLWGPLAPTGVNVTSGEGSVELALEGTQENQSTVVAYCAKGGTVETNDETTTDSGSCSCFAVGDDSGSGGTAGAAGTGGAGGMGGGGNGGTPSGSSECDPGPLEAGVVPPVNWVPCAESTTVNELENNVTYAIAAAYRDNIGNVGPLSPVVCATPAPIEDFFENYNKSGGTGGGGFCSMSHRTMRNTSFGASFALGALAFVVRRRARVLRYGSSKEVSK